ncbi:MAG: TetR/AcrR family transcriptional regulator [Rubrivivax sp.]|jgi:AcrR family transcriptional regulator|nr:TetR/AcrR family transcriptional regulator [Rubrivivax sp.]
MTPPPAPADVAEAPATPTLAEQRSAQILAAAVTLFAERGYVDTKIEDISNAIGVGKGLIYRYFRDKQEVLFHAISAVQAEYTSGHFAGPQGTEDPVAALRRMLRMHCRVADEHTLETLLAYRSTKDLSHEQRERIKALESGIVAEIRHHLDAAIAAGRMQITDTQVAACQFLMYGHGWALKRWALEPEVTIERYIDAGERLLIDPFVTPR